MTSTTQNQPAPYGDASAVSTLLGGAVPAKTISDMAREGRLPSVKFGRRRLYHLPTVLEHIAEAQSAGRPL